MTTITNATQTATPLATSALAAAAAMELTKSSDLCFLTNVMGSNSDDDDNNNSTTVNLSNHNENNNSNNNHDNIHTNSHHNITLEHLKRQFNFPVKLFTENENIKTIMKQIQMMHSQHNHHHQQEQQPHQSPPMSSSTSSSSSSTSSSSSSTSTSFMMVNNSNECLQQMNQLKNPLNSCEFEQETEGQKSFLISDLLNSSSSVNDEKGKLSMIDSSDRSGHDFLLELLIVLWN
ncbi:unnamed protein product [Trichobilharzia regenti]|nr:unnamed protein product [Trichobilharzia regenti]